MTQNRTEKKKKRPISRRFWKVLRFMPEPLRAWYIRSRFMVDYDLPKEIVLKQAETQDEIEQALKLVHDSYVELNYIDRVESELRFSRFHALPTTVILIAKHDEEVIGTISIIPDSAMGLPSDLTWDLSKYRRKGRLIAEISSLAIKKNFRMRRGKMLLPLCKIMFMYCEKIFKLDGIVIATTLEVEPFYLHVLLFEKVVAKTGQKHKLVKDNPSTCCFLKFGPELVDAYKKVYASKPLNRNLHHFFVEDQTPNIQLPQARTTLQSYNLKKNLAKTKIIQKHPHLAEDFTSTDKLVIQNLEVIEFLSYSENSTASNFEQIRDMARFDVRLRAWCIFHGEPRPLEGQLIDVSSTGFKMNLLNTERITRLNDEVVVVLEFGDRLVHCSAIVKWVNRETRLGCEVVGDAPEWQTLMNEIYSEIYPHTIRPIKNVG